MLTFSEFCKQVAVKSSMPFSLDFSIKTRGVSKDVRTIAGVDLPVYGQLLIRESYFLELYQRNLLTQASLLEIELEKLAFKLHKDLDLPKLAGVKSTPTGLQLARWSISGGAPESHQPAVARILESESYTEWTIEVNETLQQLIAQVNELKNNTFHDAVRVTFILSSRTGGDWVLDDTFALLPDDYLVALEFYRSEAGLDKSEAQTPDEPPVDVPDLGKE